VNFSIVPFKSGLSVPAVSIKTKLSFLFFSLSGTIKERPSVVTENPLGISFPGNKCHKICSNLYQK